MTFPEQPSFSSSCDCSKMEVQSASKPESIDMSSKVITARSIRMGLGFIEWFTEYDIASLFMVGFYCFVTKVCARRPGADTSVERRQRERRTLLAGAAGKLAGAIRLRQARPSSACTFSGVSAAYLRGIRRQCPRQIPEIVAEEQAVLNIQHLQHLTQK